MPADKQGDDKPEINVDLLLPFAAAVTVAG
jgi:hypothetical protein